MINKIFLLFSNLVLSRYVGNSTSRFPYNIVNEILGLINMYRYRKLWNPKDLPQNFKAVVSFLNTQQAGVDESCYLPSPHKLQI